MKKKLLALFLCCALSFGLVTAALITPAAADEDFLVYGSDGLVAHTVELAKNNKLELTAVASTGSGVYQWQIQVGGDVWANISGANGVTLDVSYALVANLLYGGAANLRCRLTAGETVKYTNTVTVQITDETPVSAPAQALKAPTVISEAEPVGEPVIIPPQTAVEEAPAPDAAPANDLTGNAAPASLADPAPVNDPAPSDDGGEEPEPQISTYTILIKYQFADGRQAANPWSATVAAGSTYTQTITSPVVVGYTPDKPTVEVNASEETTYIVTYQPAVVEFTVKHYQQNVHNDLYTLVDTETKTGYTESAVGEQLAKTDYTGFYSLLYDTTTKIAADGSTVIEVYYDRYYFLLNFDLDGGYGVEPVYARYGAPIGAGTPTKPGYTFEKWTPEIPDTMPAANSSHKASWNIGESGFTVVFWYENANDDGYSVAGTYKPADVAPGTEKKSEDYKDQSFTGRDNDHFTYNAAKAETVTVKGDGSTVLNVYFTRNSYTLTFVGVGNDRVLACGKTESGHKHSDSCCKYGGLHLYHWSHDDDCCKLGLSNHKHSNSCYGTGFTITAKYDSDISNIWKTDPVKSALAAGNVFKSSVTGKYYSFLEKMPGQDITMTKTQWSGNTYEWYYYLEVPAGMSAPAGATTKTDGGKTYYLYHTVTVKGESITLTYDEDYYPITGFTQRDKNVPSFDNSNKAYLYYTRNKYELKFLNYGTLVKTDTKYYQADISGEGFTPNYPETLENGVYTFDAWYTDQFFSESGKFDFTGAVMPAGPVVLYAHWVSKTHTVKTYQTKDAMENGGTPLTVIHNIPHGAKVGDVASVPGHPVNGNYIFAGWFYVSDTGEEKAFDFSMPVNRDLNLYAKWSSNTLMAYTVKYELKDGTETAPPTTGSALAGTTKTFNAKSGTELNEGYQSGHFPKVGSHSITIDIDNPENNTFTFVYVPKAEVEYIVRYLDKATSNPVVVDGVPTPDKTVKTRDAVVTETFKQIPGYAPDAYQKQLVLAAEGNEIIFWYIKDDVHAPVQTIHWVQNIKGEGYAEYQKSTNLNGVIGTEYSETPLTITGFEYHSSPEHPVDGYPAKASGTLTEAGLVLNLYYDRIEYPYEFRFLEQGTNKELADSVTGNARYQAQVTQTAKAIPGYTLVSAENQAINIAIEDPANVASKNVKTFYYTEQVVDIKYQVVGPDNCGSLDNYQESQLKVTTGTVKGAVPTAADGFKFVGWYKDVECKQAVDAAWIENNKITPQKTADLGNGTMGYEAATYYAKFEYDVADLTINKQGWQAIDENQSFIFDVTGPNGYYKRVVIQGSGSVTIKGLKVGTYSVTEVTDWSWRYKTADGTANSIEHEIKPKDGFVFDFTNSRENGKWLGGDAYSKNVFGTIIETDSGN